MMQKNTYKIIGNGKKKIVFIHHFKGDANVWLWLSKRLSKTHTCILLNLPGFNKTELQIEPSLYSYSVFINEQIKALKLKK